MNIELLHQKSYRKWLFAGAFILLLSYAAYAVTSRSYKQVSLAELSFVTVVQGGLDIYANAYGEFVSAKERLLTAPASGKVAEIMLRPGAQVAPESIILRLTNPRLVLEVNEAKGLLNQHKAKKAELQFKQQNERLNYQGRIADLEASVEKAELELSIYSELSERGVASKIKLRRAQLILSQENKRLDFEKDKYQQFKKMQSYQLTQNNIVIEQQNNQLELLRQQLDDMQIKARISGTLQTLEIKLGQSVQQGYFLAKVGSDKELVARLRLPQRQADLVALNSEVKISANKTVISARISRVETLVAQGSVVVEAIIDDVLTLNARPQQSISARVFIEHRSAAIYLKQVPGFRPQSSQNIFVQNGDKIEKRKVIFGELSEDKILVIDGLSAGDKVVSSNTLAYQTYPQLQIIK